MRSLKLTTRIREWRQVFLLTILFLLYTLHTTILIHLYLVHVKGLDNIKAVIPNYQFLTELKTTLLASFIGGIFFSCLEIFYFSKRFKHYSYGKSILSKFLLYGMLAYCLTIFATIFYNCIHLEQPFYSNTVLEASQKDLASKGIFFTLIMVIVPVLLMIFVVQINEKMGQGVLWQLLTGRYREPKEQTRIFMFLDIKSSTSIAEKIGHARFYNLLNHFFADITNPIVKNKGEIYQYIGDEVVITWTLPNGILKSNCIQCFFDICDAIQEKATFYKEQFGTVPQFKAGMHYGKVMTGEIGIIKKEITHTGDVLNTTSRIQEMCNTLDSKFIVSRPLIDNLVLDGLFDVKELGLLEIRGRAEKVELVAIRKKSKVSSKNFTPSYNF